MIIRIANDGGRNVIEVESDDATTIETYERLVPQPRTSIAARSRLLRYGGTAVAFGVALVVGMALGGLHATPATGEGAAFRVPPIIVPPPRPTAAILPPPATQPAAVSAHGLPPRIAAALSSRPTAATTPGASAQGASAVRDPEKLFGLQP